MTRDELIMAIYDSDEAWSCPDHPCDFVEESRGNDCMKCAEKQLAEHDAKVREDAIKEYKSKLRKQFLEYYDEHGYPCLSDIREILDDCEMKLKEQKENIT